MTDGVGIVEVLQGCEVFALNVYWSVSVRDCFVDYQRNTRTRVHLTIVVPALADKRWRRRRRRRPINLSRQVLRWQSPSQRRDRSVRAEPSRYTAGERFVRSVHDRYCHAAGRRRLHVLQQATMGGRRLDGLSEEVLCRTVFTSRNNFNRFKF